MIKQIVKSQEELEKLIREELDSPEKSNNQHGDNTEEEMGDFVEAFFEEYQPEYPAVAVVEFNFIYHGLDIDLNGSAHFITPKQITEFHKELNA